MSKNERYKYKRFPLMVSKTRLIERINAAKQETLAAENDLDKILLEFQDVSQSGKVAITRIIEEAFARLNSARMLLVEMESLVGTIED